MSIFRPLSEPEGSYYQIAGINISCPHCKNQEFYESRVQCNAYEPTYAENEPVIKTATALCCSRCSLILYFANKPDKVIV